MVSLNAIEGQPRTALKWEGRIIDQNCDNWMGRRARRKWDLAATGNMGEDRRRQDARWRLRVDLLKVFP